MTITRELPLRSTGNCVLFDGHRNSAGYGLVHIGGGRRRVAHRVTWEAANGPIPDGLVVMHACDNPPCINLAHLSLGTVADNNRDRQAKGRTVVNPDPGAHQRSKSHCPQSHPYDDENTYRTPDGKRACRMCRTSASSRYNAKRRSK